MSRWTQETGNFECDWHRLKHSGTLKHIVKYCNTWPRPTLVRCCLQCHVWIQVSRLMAVLRRRISLAAKVLTWQRWHQSACRCHQDSLSPLRFARTSIRMTARTRKSSHIRRRLSNSFHFFTDWLRLVCSIKSGWCDLLATCTANGPLMSRFFGGAFCLQVEEALQLVEKRTGRVFGDDTNPLLVSVRSGARASMPGDARAVSWRLSQETLNVFVNRMLVDAA